MEFSATTIAVIALNCVFGLLNVGLCWQFWSWRRQCRAQRRRLQAFEQTAQDALTTATAVMRAQRFTSKTWRSRLYQLQLYGHSLRQLLRLLAMVQQGSEKLGLIPLKGQEQPFRLDPRPLDPMGPPKPDNA